MLGPLGPPAGQLAARGQVGSFGGFFLAKQFDKIGTQFACRYACRRAQIGHQFVRNWLFPILDTGKRCFRPPNALGETVERDFRLETVPISPHRVDGILHVFCVTLGATSLARGCGSKFHLAFTT